MTSQFVLRKAYIDAIDPQGGWWIGYDTALKWGALHVNYREISAPAVRIAKTTFRPRDVTIGAAELSSKGRLRLQGGSVAAAEISLQTPVLEWRLTHRGADVIVTTSEGPQRIPSAGYGEVVTLHRLPWDLGLRELSWGRYMSDRHFVVWIVGTGEHAIAFGVVGNKTSKSASVEARRIRIADTSLSLDRVVSTISQGDAIRDRAWPARTLVGCLASGFSVMQHKAVYASTLHLPDGAEEKGLAIAEHVSFSRGKC